MMNDVKKNLEDALLHSDKPSAYFENLRKTDSDTLSEYFPELQKLIDLPQNPVHHPEGDVWTHTMLVLDYAASIREDAHDPLAFMLSALAHDFGKALCTECINGVIHAYSHEDYGTPLAEIFLRRLAFSEDIIRIVKSHVRLHMKPNVIAKQKSAVKKSNHMFDESAEGFDLLLLAEADHHGRTDVADYAETSEFLHNRLAVYHEVMERPHLTDADILEMGCSESQLEEVSAYAHKLRLACVSVENAVPQVRSMIKK